MSVDGRPLRIDWTAAAEKGLLRFGHDRPIRSIRTRWCCCRCSGTEQSIKAEYDGLVGVLSEQSE